MPGANERRRSPRVELSPSDALGLELRGRVQLVDISHTGALLACDIRLPVGTSGQFRAGLAATPFASEISIRRHHDRALPNQRTGLAAVFMSMDDTSRRSLEQFLRRASE